MEELKEYKLNIIEKIRKNMLLRRMRNPKVKPEEVEKFLKLKNPKLIYDKKLVQAVYEKGGDTVLKELPEVFQLKIMEEVSDASKIVYCGKEVQKKLMIEQSSKYQYALVNLDKSVQMEVVKKNSCLLSKCNIDVQKEMVEQDKNLLCYVSKELLKEMAILIKQLGEEQQKLILAEQPELILYADEQIRNEILTKKDSESIEWQTVIEQEKDFEEFYRILNTVSKKRQDNNNRFLEGDKLSKADRMALDSKEKLLSDWLNNCSKEYIYKLINELNNKQKNGERLDGNVIDLIGVIKNIDIDKQQIFFENRSCLETYLSIGNELGEKHLERDCEEYFSKECIITNFEKIYGTEKYSQYYEIINEIYAEPSKYNKEEKSRLLNMFFREEMLTRETNATQIKQYFSEEDDAKKQQIFESMIRNAYGEKAARIVHERNGLLLEDIDNTEIFSPEIRVNFREGFIQDLLSYSFDEVDEFVKVAKNPEDLKAFKFFYERMSGVLGENAVTMKMCMERYSEYSKILKEATKEGVKLTEEQLSNLDKLCTWRENIAEITKLEELPELEQRLVQAISNIVDVRRSKKIENNSKPLFKNDILLKNFESESTIYDLPNSLLMVSLENLYKAIEAKQPIAGAFLEGAKTINEKKKESMELFQEGIVTDEHKIDEAAKEGRDGVKVVVIDGIKVIDLGDMKCNFAMHSPYMEMSYNPSEKNIPKRKDYMKYDKRIGMSIISAYAITESGKKEEYHGSSYRYVYWDFKDNEVMGLSTDNGGDAKASHSPRMIKPAVGRTDRSLKTYSRVTDHGANEITFYRRYRNHSRIEQEGHGGKVIPSAIIGDPSDPIVIKIAQERFGKPIPIICKRHDLDDEKIDEKIKNIKAAIAFAYKSKWSEEVISIDGNIDNFKRRAKKEGLVFDWLADAYGDAGIRTEELVEGANLIVEGKKMQNDRDLGIDESNIGEETKDD